jgi:hypothetical protein
MAYRWGLQRLYRFLSPREADFVRGTGCKALPFDSGQIRLYLAHENEQQLDPVAALWTVEYVDLARFYAPMLRFIQFARGMATYSGVDFEIFEIPSSELSALNSSIDGKIQLLQCNKDGD